jgi:hypothetical protein
MALAAMDLRMSHVNSPIFEAGMLTGIEQYHWERAGYFIRRSYLNDDMVLELRGKQNSAYDMLRDFAKPLIDDLIGELNEGVGQQDGVMRAWKRAATGISYSEDHSGLAGQPEGVVLRLALVQDEAMQVMPGSHATPLAAYEVSQLKDNPAADVPGAVRVRLAPGDALFYHATLLAKHDTDENALEIQFRKQRR